MEGSGVGNVVTESVTRAEHTDAARGPSEAEHAGPDPRWTRRRFFQLLAPAMVFLAVREIGLLVLDWMAARNKTGITPALTSWDGLWFLYIADRGYHGVPSWMVDAFGHRSPETPLAFFPGYPLVVKAVSYLPGVSITSAAFAVSVVAGVACAYALERMGIKIGGSRRAGLVLVALFAASPMAIVLSMAYSEALFCALAAWTLVGLLERRWLLAGLCCAAAGLVRPTTAALVLAVAVAVVPAIVRRQDGWRPWLAGLLAPVGLVAYLGWVGRQAGSWNGWLRLQEQGWDSRFDGGRATLDFSLKVLASGRSVLEVATVWLVIVAIVLFVIAVRMRLPWPLLVYTAGVLFIDLGSNGLMNSKARLLVPAFVLLLPVAVALGRRRPATIVTVLAGVAVASAWFGAYSITSWGYAI